MSRWRRLLGEPGLRNAAVVGVVGLTLLGNIAFLLVEYSSAQHELERAASERVLLETRQRAAALEYFFSERRGDLVDLANAREVASFFENQALGMSMAYGLRASLLNIGERFRRLLDRHRLRGTPIFARIVLLDEGGEVLAEARAPGVAVGPVPAPLPASPDKAAAPRLRLDTGGRRILVEVPYHFKGRKAGRIVCWLADSVIYDAFLRRPSAQATRYDLLLAGDDGAVFDPDGWARLPPALEARRPWSDLVHFAERPERGAKSRKMVAIHVPMTDTPFAVLAVVPRADALGQLPSRSMLVVSVTLSALVLGSLALVLRFRQSNRRLRAKFAATDRARGELQGRYSALEDEMRRRKAVEAELRLKQQQVEERTQELQKAVQEAHVLAFYDGLTGLANRLLFNDRLEQAIGGARRSASKVAVLFLDLDRFKRINDTLGHQIGDQLLKETARRIERAAREIDTVGRPCPEHAEAYVSRQGGDEFTVLVTGLAEPHDAAKVAQRIIHRVGESLTVDGYEMLITTSIGISVYPEDGEDVESLTKNADTAMYSAKDRGGDAYAFYEPAMNAESLARLSLEAEMRKALQRGEFELFYQPKVDARSALLTGVEALIRWRHPERGLVPPGEFIPLAEETGLIGPLSNWVLATACVDCRRWETVYGRRVPVSVNLSGRHFRQQNILEHVDAALSATGLDPAALEVELTESVLMHNTDHARYVLNRLRERGVRVALDDFGTGYSSLSYLKSFPIDTLKIDRSFVRDVPGDPSDAALVKAISAMAASLDLRIVAEGVETPEQLQFLAEVGCHEVQGYLLSPPMPEPAFARSLRERAESARYLPLAGRNAACA